jgi:hypothetical protein
MQNEIEAFLRRVAQVREAAEARKQPRVPPPPLQQQQPVQQRVARLTDTVDPALLSAEVVDAELAESAGEVERSVVEHMRGTAEIAERVRHLGEATALADDKLEAHLHQTFDHQIGRLKKTASDTAARPHDPLPTELNAAELSSRFHSLQSVREAIIMAEVLRRPEERWRA